MARDGTQWQWWRGASGRGKRLSSNGGGAQDCLACGEDGAGTGTITVDGIGSKRRYGTTDAEGGTGNGGDDGGSGLATVVVELLAQHP